MKSHCYEAFEKLSDTFTVLQAARWFVRTLGSVGEIDFLIDCPNYSVLINAFDDGKKSENEFYTLAANRLSKLEKGHTDISSAVVNFKQPAQGQETVHIYEVTIVVCMGSENIAATEKGEQFRATLDGALNAVERKVHEHREQ